MSNNSRLRNRFSRCSRPPLPLFILFILLILTFSLFFLIFFSPSSFFLLKFSSFTICMFQGNESSLPMELCSNCKLPRVTSFARPDTPVTLIVAGAFAGDALSPVAKFSSCSCFFVRFFLFAISKLPKLDTFYLYYFIYSYFNPIISYKHFHFFLLPILSFIFIFLICIFSFHS